MRQEEDMSQVVELFSKDTPARVYDAKDRPKFGEWVVIPKDGMLPQKETFEIGNGRSVILGDHLHGGEVTIQFSLEKGGLSISAVGRSYSTTTILRDGETCMIGRNPSANDKAIKIPPIHEAVSRNHMLVELKGGKILITDLSMNGVRVVD